MLPVLRDYQVPCVEQGLYFFRSTRIEKPRILVAPTAAGKSIIIAAIANGLEGKVLVIQPSAELLKQNYNKYLLYDHNVSAFSASVGQKKLAKVTFATIGTIVSCPEVFLEYSHLIIDECHVYPKREESMFGKFIAANPQLKILGLTATPFRLQSSRNSAKLSMLHNSGIYSNYQHIIQIQDIAPKFWAKITYVFDHGKTSVLKVNTTGADYDARSLALYGHSVEDQIKKTIQTFIEQPILIFVPSVEQAMEMSKADKGSGVVWATMPKPDRAQLMRDFLNGKVMRVYNFGILGIGFDFPALTVLIDAIPTLSLAKHYQKVGRLTRPHPLGLHIQKYYIDLAENTKHFGYMEDLEIRKIGTTYHVFSKDKQITGRDLRTLDIDEKPAKKEVKFENMMFNFGKFKGKRIVEIPKWYLSWCLDNLGDAKMKNNINLFLTKDEQPAQLF